MRSSLRHIILLLLAASLSLSPEAFAGRHSYSNSRLKTSTYRNKFHYHTTHRTRLSSPYTSRDSHGRIKRSSVAKRQFMKQTGYPHGRPGYVVDHIVPLSKGGADTPGNMQWQTKEEARAKDKWERGGHPSSARLKRYHH